MHRLLIAVLICVLAWLPAVSLSHLHDGTAQRECAVCQVSSLPVEAPEIAVFLLPPGAVERAAPEARAWRPAGPVLAGGHSRAPPA
jgi:hypothetical protein